jgi:hypothetical protein
MGPDRTAKRASWAERHFSARALNLIPLRPIAMYRISSALGHEEGPMNRPSRCDEIVELIDRCLAEVGFDPGPQPSLASGPAPSPATADHAHRAASEIDKVRHLVRQRRLEADLRRLSAEPVLDDAIAP